MPDTLFYGYTWSLRNDVNPSQAQIGDYFAVNHCPPYCVRANLWHTYVVSHAPRVDAFQAHVRLMYVNYCIGKIVTTIHVQDDVDIMRMFRQIERDLEVVTVPELLKQGCLFVRDLQEAPLDVLQAATAEIHMKPH